MLYFQLLELGEGAENGDTVGRVKDLQLSKCTG